MRAADTSLTRGTTTPVPLTQSGAFDPTDLYRPIGICAVRGTNTVIGMLATNNFYFQGIVALAGLVRGEAACVLASVPIRVSDSSPLVLKLQFPLASKWLPEPEFCVVRTSGWRQASVLKTQLLEHILQRSYDALIVDADWRVKPAGTIAPVLLRLNSLKWDMVAPSDVLKLGHRLMNVGLMWMRSSSAMRQIVSRSANRSYAAWDQLIVNQEVESYAAIRCCDDNVHHMLQRVFYHQNKSSEFGNGAKFKNMSQETCSALRPALMALPPPNCTGHCASIFAKWNPWYYNAPAHRMSSKCVNVPCDR
jgi:hypothetical protein